jgi:hypothetical protein
MDNYEPKITEAEWGKEFVYLDPTISVDLITTPEYEEMYNELIENLRATVYRGDEA